MSSSIDPELFVGRGDAEQVHALTGRTLLDWQPHEDDIAVRSSIEHPRGYVTDEDVVAAVNTALLLGKPLLLAGNPGTGKSQLAERIAWEFRLSPVLRFEAQSLSEAQDLFYRFDLVGRLARTQLDKTAGRPRLALDDDRSLPRVGGLDTAVYEALEFMSFGPLGKAILRAAEPPPNAPPELYRQLLRHAFPNEQLPSPWSPRRSVVLIDEIDKASRDFPNDLLNAIERLEFRIRELGALSAPIRVSDREDVRPIVIVTSNGEREIPAPFLRRCVFCHIPDPQGERLREIIWNRVLEGAPRSNGSGVPQLPKLYEDLLGVFLGFRGDGQAFYRAGTSELVDWSRAMKLRGARPESELMAGENPRFARETASAVAKNGDDRNRLLERLRALEAGTLAKS